MKPAWRGIVFKGEVWAWPTALMTHAQAFARRPDLHDYSCRWRQWTPGGVIDFDPGASDADKQLVEAWVAVASKPMDYIDTI
jgi:hypothetical protein